VRTGAIQELFAQTLPSPDGVPAVGLSRRTMAFVPAFVPNMTIFTLGVLLIEICLGQSLEELRAQQNANPESLATPKIYADYETAMRLLNSDRILEEGGPKYDSAVRRGITGNFEPRSTDLENDEFRQAFHDGVLAMLEDLVDDVLAPVA
jgi:hypothetical protein